MVSLDKLVCIVTEEGGVEWRSRRLVQVIDCAQDDEDLHQSYQAPQPLFEELNPLPQQLPSLELPATEKQKRPSRTRDPFRRKPASDK